MTRCHKLTGARAWCSTWSTRTLVLFAASALSTLTLRAQGLWRDEVDQWRFALSPLRELIGNLTRPGWNGPLYSLLLRFWMHLVGDSVFSMRYLSVIWGVLCVAVVVVLAVRLTGMRQVGLLSGALMATSPYVLWYAQEVKMYTWVPLLAVLALYALDRACVRPRARWWLVVLLSTTLAMYSHILAALLIPVLAVWFVIAPDRPAAAWRGGLLTLGGLSLPYVPLLLWQAPMALVPRETGYPPYTLAEMVRALLNGWSVGVAQVPVVAAAIAPAAVIATALLALLGLAVLVSLKLLPGGGWRTGIRVATWCALPLALLWLVSQRGPIFTDRYLIWSAPAFYILVACGVWALARLATPLAAAALAGLLLINAQSWAAQASWPVKPAFPAVVRYVETKRRQRDLLLFQIPHNHHVYGYYARDSLDAWAGAPYTNWREPDGSYSVGLDHVARELRPLLAGFDRVWLIYTEVALWDERELVKQWLTDNYALLSSRDFPGVALFLYARPRAAR